MLTNFWGILTAWYNLPFTLLLLLALLLAMLQLLGLGGGDADSDVEGEAELGAPEGDANAEADIDGEADADSDGEPAFAWLAHLGVGKAPLLVVVLLLVGSVGSLGWLMNGLIQGLAGAYPAVAFALVLPLATLAGAFVTAQAARLIGRALPPVSTTVSRADALVGGVGTVTSPFVDERYGLVHIRNPGGTLISVFAVTEGDEPIRRGRSVVLAAYDDRLRRYVVTPVTTAEHSPP